mmetsp:Transcript_63606/g.132430  ORF Transcript_63606/g.132430 Transcript_63606/m.132430 type:complete len:174 (-) Transcript_63606:19-540(-)
MRESAAEDEFDSPEAQDLPEQCRWCSKDSTTSVLQGKANVSWGDKKPLHPRAHKWCGACKNQHKRWAALAQAPPTSPASPCADPASEVSSEQVSSETLAAQTAADSHTNINVLTPNRLRKRAANLALEAKAAKRANLYAGQRNSSLQGDNDALCSHVQDLHTVHCQAEFLRNT